MSILAACSPGEIRAAAVRDGVLIDYAVERPGGADGVGDRMRGRVVAHVPGMAGAFVALPGGEEGFLPDSQGGAGVLAGAAVIVRVTRAAQGGKGKRLTALSEGAGGERAGGGTSGGVGPPALLARGPGAIARLLALHAGAAVVVDDAGAAGGLAAAGVEVRVVARAWDEGVEEAVAALAETSQALAGGVVARFHPTPALVAIDMDAAPTGRVKAVAQREANRAALPELGRAIRLRNLSGAIVIDLAGMAVRARGALGPDLVRALADDPLGPRFLGFTALGLAEVLRPRVHPPLHELLAGPHAAGLLALRALERGDSGVAQAVRAAPDVVRALEGDGVARADLARRTGRALMLRADPVMAPGQWRLERIDRASLERG